jgi:hypothetical protein
MPAAVVRRDGDDTVSSMGVGNAMLYKATANLGQGEKMRIRSFLLGVVGALLALQSAAQDVVGRWNASIDTPNGSFSFVFEFLVDAAGMLTGSMQNEFFGSTPIKEGVVNGSELSFKLTFEGGPDGPMTISYTGTVSGAELAITSKFEGAPPGGGPAETSFTATRAK